MANGDKDKEGQAGGYFKANGLEHYTFSPKTIISWGVLSGLVGLFIASISVFQSFGSNVDQRIENYRPLNEKLWSNQRDIGDLKEKTNKHDSQIQGLWDAVNKRKP